MLRKSRAPPQGGPPEGPADEVVLNGRAMAGMEPVGMRHCQAAKRVRDDYCEYFNNVGSVPWQNNMVPPQ